MQWAVVRCGSTRRAYVVFRGSKVAFDWTENAHLSLQRVVCGGTWGTLLVHGGFWGAVENERDLLGDALQRVAARGPLRGLTLCGGSKGGASAMATAVLLLAPRMGRLEIPCEELTVTTFGAPNVVGRGDGQQEPLLALEELRAAVRRRSPQSKAWVFREDPVPALLSHRSKEVLRYYGLKARHLRWLMPSTLEGARGYLEGAFGLAETFEPMLTERYAPLPRGVQQTGGFDASFHVQSNYTAALCRMMQDGSLVC